MSDEADRPRDEAAARRRFRGQLVGDALVWLALLGLLATSFGAALAPLGRFTLGICLGLALAQVALLGLVFMHLRHARTLIALTAGAGLVFVAVMFTFTLNDLFTRV